MLLNSKSIVYTLEYKPYYLYELLFSNPVNSIIPIYDGSTFVKCQLKINEIPSIGYNLNLANGRKLIIHPAAKLPTFKLRGWGAPTLYAPETLPIGQIGYRRHLVPAVPAIPFPYKQKNNPLYYDAGFNLAEDRTALIGSLFGKPIDTLSFLAGVFDGYGEKVTNTLVARPPPEYLTPIQILLESIGISSILSEAENRVVLVGLNIVDFVRMVNLKIVKAPKIKIEKRGKTVGIKTNTQGDRPTYFISVEPVDEHSKADFIAADGILFSFDKNVEKECH